MLMHKSYVFHLPFVLHQRPNGPRSPTGKLIDEPQTGGRQLPKRGGGGGAQQGDVLIFTTTTRNAINRYTPAITFKYIYDVLECYQYFYGARE